MVGAVGNRRSVNGEPPSHVKPSRISSWRMRPLARRKRPKPISKQGRETGPHHRERGAAEEECPVASIHEVYSVPPASRCATSSVHALSRAGATPESICSGSSTISTTASNWASNARTVPGRIPSRWRQTNTAPPPVCKQSAARAASGTPRQPRTTMQIRKAAVR